MNCEEKPVLQVKNLTVRYGKGCPQCQTHLEKNRCTVCGTVWAANDVSVEVYPRCWASWERAAPVSPR